MLLQPWKLIMLSMMITGTLMTINSSSWLGTWMGMEINLMGIIPILTSEKNSRHSEAALKYFLIQALGSSMLILSFLLLSTNLLEPLMATMVLISMLIKSGVAPFHFWIPPVSEGLKYSDLLLVLTWQKVAPMFIMIYLLPEINMNILFISIITSVILGATGGFNQSSNRKILAYSSIAHSGWLIAAIMISIKTWTFYMVMYMTVLSSIITTVLKLNMNKISQNPSLKKMQKTSLLLTILSLSGLPPLLGFLPKLMMILQFTNISIPIIYLMTMCALITMFYYLRICYSTMTMNYSSIKTPMFSTSGNNQIMMNTIPILLIPMIFL